jgi:hypothetical protein
MEDIDVPQQFVIENLRHEIARLNDERISLKMKFEFSLRIIESMRDQVHQIDASPIEEENETQHETV